MIPIKKISTRMIMTLLFIGALFVTIQSITGLNVNSIVTSMNETIKDDTNQTYLLKSLEPSDGGFIPFNHSVKANSGITTVEAATQSIEEQLDLSKYPKLKVTATGYTAGVESTGKSPDHPEYGITYSGVMVKKRFIFNRCGRFTCISYWNDPVYSWVWIWRCC